MNELGILIDVSQLTTPALKQVLSLTKAPVVATHSGIRAIVDATRNLSDEELELIQKNGGVVQVVAFGNYLRKSSGGENGPSATVAQLVDSIAYAVKKIGIDHVGIASDFNGGGGIDGWNNAGETLNVTLELVRRGYTEDQIAKIWGGNLLRVMEQVERYAAGLKKRTQ